MWKLYTKYYMVTPSQLHQLERITFVLAQGQGKDRTWRRRWPSSAVFVLLHFHRAWEWDQQCCLFVRVIVRWQVGENRGTARENQDGCRCWWKNGIVPIERSKGCSWCESSPGWDGWAWCPSRPWWVGSQSTWSASTTTAQSWPGKGECCSSKVERDEHAKTGWDKDGQTKESSYNSPFRSLVIKKHRNVCLVVFSCG